MNKWLVIGVCLLVFSPLLLFSDSEFLGSDSQAENAIVEMNPGYEPWFQSLFEPASGEIESLLFALQAAIGAGFIGYVIGLAKGRRQDRDSNQ